MTHALRGSGALACCAPQATPPRRAPTVPWSHGWLSSRQLLAVASRGASVTPAFETAIRIRPRNRLPVSRPRPSTWRRRSWAPLKGAAPVSVSAVVPSRFLCTGPLQSREAAGANGREAGWAGSSAEADRAGAEGCGGQRRAPGRATQSPGSRNAGGLLLSDGKIGPGKSDCSGRAHNFQIPA
jgi:hypothetical protein